MRGYSRGGDAYGNFDYDSIGTQPDLLSALAPTISNLTGPGGPVSEEQLSRQKGLMGQSLMGENSSVSRNRVNGAGRSGFSRDIAMQAGERDSQMLGQKYRSEADRMEVGFSGERAKIMNMVGEAAMGTTMAVAGINQREKEEADRRSWYDKIQRDEKKRRNKRATMGLVGAGLGMLGGWAAGRTTEGAGQGQQQSGKHDVDFSGLMTGQPDGFSSSGQPDMVGQIAESMMPNLSMQSIGLQLQTMNQMKMWSQMLQGAQMGMGIMQGFDF